MAPVNNGGGDVVVRYTPKLKGTKFEYRVKEALEREGYLVFRMTGSTPFDLLAVKDGRMLIVECKVDRRHFTPTSKKKLLEYRKLAETHFKIPCEAILAYREGKRLFMEKIEDS